jgi:hypothetical protein
MHNRNIYKENWKIPAARQQFSVRGSISITARPRSWQGKLIVNVFIPRKVGVGKADET